MNFKTVFWFRFPYHTCFKHIVLGPYSSRREAIQDASALTLSGFAHQVLLTETSYFGGSPREYLAAKVPLVYFSPIRQETGRILLGRFLAPAFPDDSLVMRAYKWWCNTHYWVNYELPFTLRFRTGVIYRRLFHFLPWKAAHWWDAGMRALFRANPQ